MPSLVIEGESGHWPMLGRDGGAPWVWGKTLEEAEAICDDANEKLGYTFKEASKIIASSFKAQRLGHT